MSSAKPGSSDHLTEQVEGWAGRVLRIYDELALSDDEAADTWGPFDLVGTYHYRERIDRVVSGALPYSVRAIDELLRSFSEKVGTSWVIAIGLGNEVGSGWWWEFVPRDGPLRGELDERVNRGQR